MPIEIEGVEFFGWDFDGDLQNEPVKEPKGNFHKEIFVVQDAGYEITKPVSNSHFESFTQEKIISWAKEAPALKTQGSVTTGVEISWDGKGNIDYSGYAQAKAKDDHGNTIEIKAERNLDGSGSIHVSTAHEVSDERPSKNKEDK